MPWVISGTEGYTPPVNYPENPAYIAPDSTKAGTTIPPDVRAAMIFLAIAAALVILAEG